MRSKPDKSVLIKIRDDEFCAKGLELYMLRLDLIHPQYGGNKWFKLKYNLQEAQSLGKDTLLTFGGAFSNHIAATAAAGKKEGFKTIGIIRGEEHKFLNPTLQFATEQGMKLVYMDRGTYRKKHTPEVITQLKKSYGEFYLVPEGGSNALAVKGCKEIVEQIKIDFDYICCPVGTGGTLAGITLSLKPHQQALGFSALKGGQGLSKEVIRLMNYYEPINEVAHKFAIISDYHFGGYAKYNGELLIFIKNFYKEYNTPLDFVYTGKMMYGIFDLIKKGFFKPGQKIIAVHTGGLQGNQGIEFSFKEP